MLAPSGPPSGHVLTEQVIVAEPEVIELESSPQPRPGDRRRPGNSITEPVTIRSAKASCGCTTAIPKEHCSGPGKMTDVKVGTRGGPTARSNETVTFMIGGYPQLRPPVRRNQSVR